MFKNVVDDSMDMRTNDTGRARLMFYLDVIIHGNLYLNYGLRMLKSDF